MMSASSTQEKGVNKVNETLQTLDLEISPQKVFSPNNQDFYKK
jgi:hypothetical protein